MATRHSKHSGFKDQIPGEEDMVRVYRAAAKDQPPEYLDSKILSASIEAVSLPRGRGPFGSHWKIPLSTAAVILLSVGVVLFVLEPDSLMRRKALFPAPPEAPLEVASSAANAPAVTRETDRVADSSAVGATPREEGLARAVPAAPAAKKSEPPARVQVAKSEPRQAPGEARIAPMKPKAEQLALRKPAPPAAAAPAVQENVAAARDAVDTTTREAKEVKQMVTAADVIAVETSGQAGSYQFNVSIRSPDRGCAQYTDWWEVVSKDGQLLYRRVLLHSHTDEQPFTRSGGPVPIQPDTIVWVRAHMNTSGYGGVSFLGSINTGFIKAAPEAGFAAGLALQPPLPDDCAF